MVVALRADDGLRALYRGFKEHNAHLVHCYLPWLIAKLAISQEHARANCSVHWSDLAPAYAACAG